MFDVLSDLDDGAPCVWGELFLAVVTLHVEFGKLSDESLLDFSVVVELLFDCYFDLYSFRMTFSPNEPSVDNFGLVESFDFLQQKRQQFFTVPITCNPWWSHVSVAESTKIDNSLFGNTNSDVSLGDGTGWTDVTNCWSELNTTHWTQDRDFSVLLDLHFVLCRSKLNEEVEIIIRSFIIANLGRQIFNLAIIKF